MTTINRMVLGHFLGHLAGLITFVVTGLIIQVYVLSIPFSKKLIGDIVFVGTGAFIVLAYIDYRRLNKNKVLDANGG